MKHLIDMAELDKSEIIGLMDEADRFREALEGREVKKLPTLRGRTIYTLFYENSTRTRSSFETAGKWMSADVINLSASTSSVKKGESLKDTGLTLAAIGADAIIMRHPSSGAPQQLAQWVAPEGKGPSVINAGDGAHQHPTQALLDAVTMRQRIGDVQGRKVLVVGDVLHSRVARSNVDLLSTLGAEVVLVAPPTLLPTGVETWPARVSSDFDAELADATAVLDAFHVVKLGTQVVDEVRRRQVDQMADLVTEHLDLDAIMRLIRQGPPRHPKVIRHHLEDL